MANSTIPPAKIGVSLRQRVTTSLHADGVSTARGKSEADEFAVIVTQAIKVNTSLKCECGAGILKMGEVPALPEIGGFARVKSSRLLAGCAAPP